jgi:hypothetical protein
MAFAFGIGAVIARLQCHIVPDSPGSPPPGALRPASAVMSVCRAGAAVASALAFSRSAMREIVRDRWAIDKLRFDLDDQGRGEILYRFTHGRWVFHFFLVSTRLPEEQKMDRNWAQSWDAMGVLCQGEWTAGREALLRVEVPKQRAGYADYDTLVYARGNRSGRLFEHVVEALAAARQPDLGMIAQVGYILRTTAFIGNGQLGTRAYAGLEPDHPFRRPYHAQMCSAFLLREYVFDLVDHMARARNPRAARLDPAYRRYLGLGNAAATGLVAFVVNHPHLMHRWSLAQEAALAQAKQRSVRAGDQTTQAFGRLLDKAIRYFREGGVERADLFATAGVVAGELERLRIVFGEFQASGTIAGGVGEHCWPMLADWAQRNVGPEAQEVLNALLLELYPDIVEAAADAFDVEERLETRPEMTVTELRELLRAHYGWVFSAAYADQTQKYFWYRSSQAPRDVRRGIRYLAPELEAENAMDTVLQVRKLWKGLEQVPADATTAELLCMHPELRHITARVQSLAGFDYAELRCNWLAQTFSPFEPVRMVLAFFGLEKFEAALPKSVRGAFMQGAPIAEDVESGRDGDWPFPLIPQAGSLAVQLAPLPAPNHGAVRARVAPPRRHTLVIAPNELARGVQAALQAHGATLGLAAEAAAIVTFAYACGEPAIAAVLQQCTAGLAPAHARITSSPADNAGYLLDAHGIAALLAAPAGLDLASAQARRSAAHTGVTVVVNAQSTVMLSQLALRCAERGLLGLVVWHARSPGLGVAIAGTDADGPWIAQAPAIAKDAVRQAAVALFGADAGSFVDKVASGAGRFGIFCAGAEADGVFERQVAPALAGIDCQIWSAKELQRRRTAWQREGLTISRSQLAALDRAAAALLVPADQVSRLRPNEDMDPLKVF